MNGEFDEIHGTSAPVLVAIYNWVNEFKHGHTSTNDEHHSGCPVEVTSSKMIDNIHYTVLSENQCAT